MSDKKISELTALTAPDGAEELVVNDSGTSKKITQANLLKGIDNSSADATAITIDASENVGIGTTSPARPLDVTDPTGDGTGGIVINSYLPTFELDDISAGGTSFILQHDTTNTLFKHDGTEKLRIQSGGGISFNGDTAAANALDDYEEGTWTPVLSGTSGTVTHDVQSGTYTKIGNMVTATFTVGCSASTATGAIVFSGMPYSALATNGNYLHHQGAFEAIHLTLDSTTSYTIATNQTTTIKIRAQASAAGNNDVNWSEVSTIASFEVRGQITYKTN